MMNKLVALEEGLLKLNKLDKLDEIESNVKVINSKMTEFEERLSNTETLVTDLQKSVEFVSSQYDVVTNVAGKLTRVEESLSAVKSENVVLKETLMEMKKINAELKDLLDTKARGMRENLIFTNIEEKYQTRDGRTFEDTESVLNDFLQNELNTTDVKFDRVHRIRQHPHGNGDRRHGQFNRPPPIVAKFTFFKDKERVRKSAYLLRGKRYGINEQFPDEIEQRRRKLYPHLRQARRNRQRAALVKDKLYVEGREIGVNVRGEVVDRQGRSLPEPERFPPAQNVHAMQNTRL